MSLRASAVSLLWCFPFGIGNEFVTVFVKSSTKLVAVILPILLVSPDGVTAVPIRVESLAVAVAFGEVSFV